MAQAALAVSIGLPRLRSAVSALAGWWLTEIGGSVPSSLVDLLGRNSTEYAVHVDDAGLKIQRNGRRGKGIPDLTVGSSAEAQSPIARGVRPGARVTLRVAPSWMLRRTVKLPAAAGADLAGATSFLIGRLSPFRNEDVLHAARLVRRDGRAKVLHVEVAIVPRERLQPVLAEMEARGLPVSHLQIPCAEPDARWVIPAGAQGVPRTRSIAERWWGRLLAAAVVLAVLGPYPIAWWVRREADMLEQRLASAQGRAGEAMALRAELSASSSASAFLRDRRRGPGVAEAVDALSGLLPDDAWLFRLDVQPGQVDVAGFSSDVPAMLRQLGRAPFSAAELTAPVMARDLGGKSRFELRLRLAEPALR